MRYSFNTAAAARYGVEEAILLDHIHFWCDKNRAIPGCNQNGHSWMYATAAQLANHFPFWNAQKIRRLLKSLTRQGALLTGRFNRSACDRTLWYAISDSAHSMFQNCNLEDSDLQLTTVKTGTAIKDTQEDSQKDSQHTYTAANGGACASFGSSGKMGNATPKADAKPASSFADQSERESRASAIQPAGSEHPASAAKPADAIAPEGFERFWQAYPRKADKRSALLAWNTLRPSAALVNAMLAALAAQCESDAWKESGGRYIPHPAKWLNHRRWEDAAPTAQAPAKRYSMPAWAQQTSRPFDPATATDILARRRPRRLKRED